MEEQGSKDLDQAKEFETLKTRRNFLRSMAAAGGIPVFHAGTSARAGTAASGPPNMREVPKPIKMPRKVGGSRVGGKWERGRLSWDFERMIIEIQRLLWDEDSPKTPAEVKEWARYDPEQKKKQEVRYRLRMRNLGIIGANVEWITNDCDEVVGVRLRGAMRRGHHLKNWDDHIPPDPEQISAEQLRMFQGHLVYSSSSSSSSWGPPP